MIKESNKFVDSNIFEGMTSISALIKAMSVGTNDRRIIKILFDISKQVSKRRELDFLTVKSKELGFDIEMCDNTVLSNYTIGNSHGGIIAICNDRIIQNLFDCEVVNNGIYYMLDGVEDPYNFGNSIRSLYASGADGIVMEARNWMGAAGVVARSSAGASELINMYQTDSCTSAIKYFKTKGYTVISAGIRDSVPLFDAELKKPLFIIIGGEKRGISRKVLDMCDYIVRIDYGIDFRGSLSTSASASVIAFEVLRKNQKL